MKRKLLVLVFLLAPVLSYAQSVALTGTVTDTPDGQTWNSGTITFTFFGPQGTSYRWTGGTLNPNTPITATLSATGTYSVSVPDNSQITPTDSSWNITVCPAVLPATSGCFKTNKVITSASTTLNLAPTSPRFTVPTLPVPVTPISAYNDFEIVGGWVGFSYYNLTTLTYRACLTATIAGCTSFGAPTSPGQFNVKTYGAVGDAKNSSSCQFFASTTLTCTDSPFLSTDCKTGAGCTGAANKLVFCVYGPTPTNETPAGTVINGFTSATTVTISNAQFNGGGVFGACTWATQDDTAAFQQAFTAALPGGATSRFPAFGSPTTNYPGTVLIPPGGYMVSGNIRDFNAVNGNTLAPSFKGGGSNSTFIYPRTDTFTAGPRACLMNDLQGANFTLSGFTVNGSGWGFNCGSSGIPFIRLNSSTFFTLQDIFIGGVGVTNNAAVLNFFQAKNGYVNQTNDQGGSSTNHTGALFELDSSSGLLIEQSFFSNNSVGGNLLFNATGVRNALGQQVSWVSGGSDECASTVNCVAVTNGSFINFVGGTIFGEPTGTGNGALQVDGTSGVYLSSMNVGPFNTSTNSNGLAIASGGFVYSTGSHIRGGGTTGSVIDAPVTATFVDDGGNIYQRCLNTTCTNITAATFSGAFTSGIVPKSSLTHTPNTCYAVTGNLLTTAQSLCTVLLDQNYQLLTMSAQSGGTTPAASSCTTPPTITISDGTRSATMVMTSGQTTWCSITSGTCTASTTTNPNQIFATGSLLTVSIGANTCATPPSNVSVNFDIQSAINP